VRSVLKKLLMFPLRYVRVSLVLSRVGGLEPMPAWAISGNVFGYFYSLV
jgi:hypothetical protein